jgi:hypothetical protein
VSGWGSSCAKNPYFADLDGHNRVATLSTPESRHSACKTNVRQSIFATRLVSSEKADLECFRHILVLFHVPRTLRLYNSSFQLVNGLIGAAKPSA